MFDPPYYAFVVPRAVVCLTIGYIPPSRAGRRAVLFGKGGKEMRKRGAFGYRGK